MEKMKKKPINEKQLIEELEECLIAWEKENQFRKNHHEKMKKEIKRFYNEGLKTQQGYRDNIGKIVDIKNLKECERFIVDISKTIPSHIVFSEVQPLMQNMVDDLSSEAKKTLESSLEDSIAVKKAISKKYRDRALKLENEEKELVKKIEGDFQIMTNLIAPLLTLSRDKWSFLWNLANWKFNAILTKQMKVYTYAVMILTIIVAILAGMQLLR